MISATRSIRFPLSVIIPLSFSGSAMVSLTVFLGFKEENGSWKMICILVRILLIWSFPSERISSPSNRISPSVGSTILKIARPVVDFPHPDSPTTPRVLPRSMVNDTSSTACSIPLGVLKYFLRFFTSSNGLLELLISTSPPYPRYSAHYKGDIPQNESRSGIP